MFFRGIPKHEIFIVTVLGFVSGFYIWNEPLKQYAKENFPDYNPREVKVYISLQMAKRRELVPARAKLVAGIAVILVSMCGYRFFLHDYIKYYRRNDAEIYANYLYECYKEEEKQSKKVDPI